MIKTAERREQRKSKVVEIKDFAPIDLIHDPHTFGQKLFKKAKSAQLKNIRLTIVRFLGRLIGRHRVIIPDFYSFLADYINTQQKQVAIIFASIIEATHDLTTPDGLEPVIKRLFDNFIHETLNPQIITLGLNTLRGICEKTPYVINQFHVTMVDNMRTYKNKNVSGAARSVFNLYKDINEDIVKKQNVSIAFEGGKVTDTINGIDLLKKYEKLPSDYRMEYDRILDDKDFKKIKLLQIKRNAEDIKNRKIGLSESKIAQMLGDDNFDKDALEPYESDNEGEDGDDEVEDDEGEEVEDDEGEEVEDDSIEEGSEEAKEDEDEFSAINSSELENSLSEQSEEGSEVDINRLTHFKKTRAQVKIENQGMEKEKYSHQRKEKGGGKTNKEKEKSKPMAMLMPKKKKHKVDNIVLAKRRVKRIKQHLGRFKKGNRVKQIKKNKR